jgi:hypothetical protein
MMPNMPNISPQMFNQMYMMAQQPFQPNPFQNTMNNYQQRVAPSRQYTGNGLC